MIRFIHRYTEHSVELRACPNVRGERTHQIWTRDAEDVADFIARWDRDGWGVYFGVATRRSGGGSIKDTLELPAVWIDIDKDEPPIDLLTGCAMPPSLVVHSGGGIHAYWVLTEPMDISALERRDEQHPAYRLLAGLQRIFASDPAVVDVARIMRVAGTHNTKYGEPREVRILHQSDAEYEPDDLLDWVSWQPQLRGEPVDPFLAAAEKLGIRASIDPQKMLAGMEYPGNVHDVQLKVSAHLNSTGMERDEIVQTIFDATKLAVGAAGGRWDWRAERKSIEEMVDGARKKFGSVVNLDAERKRRVNGPDETNDKEPVMVRVARIAMEAWSRPLVTVDGELWTYGGGVWERFTPALEHELRSMIQGACAALGKSPTGSNLNGAYRWIHEHPDLIRRGVKWDARPIVVANNGVLEIETGRMRPHSQDDWATRRVDCDVDDRAVCPKWSSFLNEALPSGAPETIQEWFGAALVRGKTRELTKGLLIYGPSRTGKTQVTEVIRALLSGNTVGLHVKAMSERFGLQALVDAAGWIADDAVSRNGVMDAEAYKVIVTGESVSVERKNKANVEVKFDMPVLLTMNSFPRISDSSDAVYNRSLVLEMNNVIAESDARPIAQEIVAEELAGVLRWAVTGWKRLKARGYYDPPETMLATNREFKDQNNPFREFCETCVERSDHHMVGRADFRKCFNNWLKAEIESKGDWSGKAIATAIKHELPFAVGERTNTHGRVWMKIKFSKAASPYLSEFGEGSKNADEFNHVPSPELREKYGVRIKKAAF